MISFYLGVTAMIAGIILIFVLILAILIAVDADEDDRNNLKTYSILFVLSPLWPFAVVAAICAIPVGFYKAFRRS